MGSLGRSRVAVLHDGRRVAATQPSALAPWMVTVEGEAPVRDRWLLKALTQVLVGGGRAPAWVERLTDELQGEDTPAGRRFPCACCDHLTLELRDRHDGCPVCGWEDDLVQYSEPTRRGGANRESLEEARANYARIGASSEKRVPRVRAPLPGEARLFLDNHGSTDVTS